MIIRGVKSKNILLYSLMGLIIIILVCCIIFLYKHILKITYPFLIALITVYTIEPIVEKLCSKGINRKLAIILVYLLIIFFIVSFIAFLIPESIKNINQLNKTIPNLISWSETKVMNIMDSIEMSNWPKDIKSIIEIQLGKMYEYGKGFVGNLLEKAILSSTSIIGFVLDLTIGLFIAFYILAEGADFKEKLVFAMPKKARNRISLLIVEINSMLSAFIKGQIWVAIIVGILESVGLIIFQVKYPILLGMIGGFSNFIPYFGPFIGAIPAVAVALSQSPIKALWTLLVFAIIQQIDNNYISPKIIENKLGMHPVTTMFVVIVGGELWGIAGMVFAVPVFVVLRALTKNIYAAISG